MKKFTLNLRICLCALSCVIFMAFSAKVILEEEMAQLQKMLTEHYDSSREEKEIKRYELNVTNSGFCRYKRYFSSGKVEYFSFNLIKFKGLDYQGIGDSTETGNLFLRTKGEDVIVQTYNDKIGGDVDSMACFMTIPVKNMKTQDLSDLSERLVKMNALLPVQK